MLGRAGDAAAAAPLRAAPIIGSCAPFLPPFPPLSLSEFGPVKSVAMNLDRRTGYAKGYALLEYASRAEAEAAIKGMSGAKLLGRPLSVSWAFVAASK